MPISLANAAVMMTSDRQFPARAANACDALRVIAASYSSFSNPLSYRASKSPCWLPLVRTTREMSLRRYSSISGLSANTSLALMRCDGGMNRASLKTVLRSGVATCDGAPAHAASSSAMPAIAQCFIPCLLSRDGSRFRIASMVEMPRGGQRDSCGLEAVGGERRDIHERCAPVDEIRNDLARRCRRRQAGVTVAEREECVRCAL